MRDIRLTLRAEDFGTIWAALIEMGISFYVEPADGPAEGATLPQREVRPAGAAPPPVPTARPGPAKPTKEKGPKPPMVDEAPATGADRLRQALARREGPDLPAAFGEPQAKGTDT